MELKATGIDEIVLRESKDGKKKGEGSSGPPTLRGQAEEEELPAKRTKMERPEA